MREISKSYTPLVSFSRSNGVQQNSSKDGDALKQGLVRDVLEAHEDCSPGHDVMESMHVASETAVSLGITGNLDPIGVGAGAAGLISGVYFGVTGAEKLKKAIQEKNVTAGIEAGGHLMQAGEAMVDTAQFAVQSSAVANMVGPTAVGIIQSPVFKGLGTGLGVAHGLIESGVGAKELYDGVKEKNRSHIITGLLDIVSGAAVAGIALGGGPAAGAALVIAYGLQMLRVHILNH